MNPRIQKLRQESLNTRESLSPERALLVTRFYESGIAQKEAVPVQRALCFRHIMKNKSLWIGDGELIVGERGPAPKATPTYPEICLHSLADLEIIHSREKVSFEVTDETRKVYEKTVIPFWEGKTIREKIFKERPASPPKKATLIPTSPSSTWAVSPRVGPTESMTSPI